ncbi:hypothetical protein ACFL1Y_00080 [Patescibacteria group bacterium]
MSAKKANTVKIIFGGNSKTDEIVGKKVSDAKKMFAQILNIPKNAKARVNGVVVKGNQVLKAGDKLEFIKPSGRKG